MSSLPGVSDDDQGPRVLSADLDLSRVLVPLDGFPAGEFALSYASVFAKCFGSNLLLFHVLPPAHPVHQVRGAPVRYPNALRDRGAILANSYLQQVASKLQIFGINAQWSVTDRQYGRTDQHARRNRRIRTDRPSRRFARSDSSKTEGKAGR